MNRFDLFAAILEDQGASVSSTTRILDFGCGEGKLVRAALAREMDAYGCDVEFSAGWIDQSSLAEIVKAGRVKPIAYRGSPLEARIADYAIPFDDSFFDIVISDQVLEHVQNLPQVVRELHRVMRPGSAFLHLFPSKFSVLEPHTGVPFGGAIETDMWLKLWAHVGIRNAYQRDFTAADAFEWNRQFVATSVNYLSRRALSDSFTTHFDVRFVENSFMRHSKRARVFVSPRLYSTFRSRVMFGRRRDLPVLPQSSCPPQ